VADATCPFLTVAGYSREGLRSGFAGFCIAFDVMQLQEHYLAAPERHKARTCVGGRDPSVKKRIFSPPTNSPCNFCFFCYAIWWVQIITRSGWLSVFRRLVGRSAGCVDWGG